MGRGTCRRIFHPASRRAEATYGVSDRRGVGCRSPNSVYSAEASWTDIALSIQGLVAILLFWCLGDATHLPLAKGVP